MLNIKNLYSEVDNNVERLILLHQELIKIESVNSGYMPTGNETEVAEFCSNWLKQYGIESNILSRVPERGNLVSEKDLSEAIKNNKIKGVAIDVFSKEPAEQNILFGLDNVILTTHIAASTDEAQIIVAEMIANQFVDYFLNNKINNSVT